MTAPNILWICTDQQRADTLGCTGNPWVRTPHLDGLAASGALFERAYCQNPLCTPSRASFMTGRYPRTTRDRQNGQSIPADERLVTRLLADAGYTCGLAGKLHLSACAPSVCTRSERRIDDGYSVFHWSHHPDDDWPAGAYNRWLRDQGQEYGRSPFRDSAHVQLGMPAEYHQTTWGAQRAIDFIEEQCGRGPWLFSLNLYDPHHPFDPPPEYLERYLDRLEQIPLPNYLPGELEDKPAVQQRDHHGAYGGQRRLYPFDQMSPADHRLVRAAYWAMCDLIDRQIGRILAALERTGQRRDTLVLFMSDHGEMLGDHGLYLKGPFFYEEAVRAPLIVSWPGAIPPSRRISALVEFVDLAPTLLEAARLPVYPGMQGRSLWPLLCGAAPPERHREDVYCEHYGTTHHPPGQVGAYATMVRTETHKLVVHHGTGEGELYDLLLDPQETWNRWCDPRQQSVKLELMRRLCDRMAWTVDPLPLRAAAY